MTRNNDYRPKPKPPAPQRDIVFNVRLQAEFHGSTRECRDRADFLVERINRLLDSADDVCGAQIRREDKAIEIITH